VSRVFVQTVQYDVRELALGPYVGQWVREAAAAYAEIDGLIAWQVMRHRTQGLHFTEVFTWQSRDVYHAVNASADFEALHDRLLSGLGELVDVDSVRIDYHEVIGGTGGGDDDAAEDGA
jgi:hypothetical protein